MVRLEKNRIGPGGGMVDTVDSKSAARKGVRVQVPPGVQSALEISALFFKNLCRICAAFFSGQKNCVTYPILAIGDIAYIIYIWTRKA